MIPTFAATFFLLSAPSVPILHLVDYRNEELCKRDAARIAKNVRLPGNIKIGIGFKCEANKR